MYSESIEIITLSKEDIENKDDKENKEDNENKENKEDIKEIIKPINHFTRNLKQFINSKKRVINNDNNKNPYILDKENEDLKKEDKDNKIIKTTADKNNIDPLNSLVELDLLNSPPMSQVITSYGGYNPGTRASGKISPNKKYNSYLHLSVSSRDQLITSLLQTTASLQIQNLKDKFLDDQKKNKNRRSKLNKKPKNIKKSNSQQNFDNFLERVKEKQKTKEMHIKNLRCKSLQTEVLENHRQPSIEKKSVILLKKNNSRKPLYQKAPLNKEKNMEKTFKNFYEGILKYNLTNTFSISNPKNIKIDYNKFYEEKINWKKHVEEKNQNQKLKYIKQYEEYLNNIPFKPSLDRNSINIANNLYKNRSVEKIDFYDGENDEYTINKFKTKIKPLISSIYNNNNYKIALYKKSRPFKRTFSEININEINNYNNSCKFCKNKTNKSKIKINYKLNEKKYLKSTNDVVNKRKKKNNGNKKDCYSKNQFENMKEVKKSNKCKPDIYKINIRPGTAWNYNVINEITHLKHSEKFIEELL